MSIPIVLPPFGMSEADWESLPLSERALLIAAQECDVYHTKEQPIGSDRGPRVDEMLRAAKCFPGNPWCAAFATWCCRQAGWNPVSEPGAKRVLYPAAVVSWIAWAKRTGRLRESGGQGIKRGDLFFFDLPGLSHMGFVAHVEDGQIETIEGNTDSAGGREGWEVARRYRAIDTPTGYISMRRLSLDK